MICYDCNGTGETVASHVSYADGRHGYNVRSKCSRCGGNGVIDSMVADWMVKGNVMRERRIAAGRSLRDEAKRRGLSPYVLSQMENGRIEPEDTLEET